MALLALFDVLARELPLNDDWVYAWVARRLGTGRGLQLFPEQSVPALPQVVLGGLAWAVHPGMVALRMESLAASVLGALMVVAIGRRLGASDAWSVVAGTSLLAYPVFAATSATFMTEPFYLALLLAASLAFLNGLEGRRSGWLLVPLVFCATLERQQGAGLAAAVVGAGLAGWRARSTTPWPLIAAAAAAAVAGLALPSLTHLATPEMGYRATVAAAPRLVLVVALATYLPTMLGLLVMPFAPVLLRVLRASSAPRGVGLILLLSAGLATITVISTHGFPGNYLTAAGLGPVTLQGVKQPLFSVGLPVLELLSLAAFAIFAGAAFSLRPTVRMQPGAVFLVILGATQAVPLAGAFFDRYFLALLAPLLPLAAVMASRVPARPRDVLAAGAVLAGMVAVFVMGEQDYLAWQAARDEMATRVLAAAPAAHFYPGYEPWGQLVILPQYESGRLVARGTGVLPLSEVPSNIDLILEFAPPGDRRPGRGYSSLAPGRVVVACRDRGCAALERLR